jgi:predicted Zn-dependent protease
MKSRVLIFSSIIVLLSAFSACSTIDDIMAGDFSSTKDAFISVSGALKEFTPEQEYYIGRAVGAMILSEYKIYWNNAANTYLNQVGQSLAIFSDRPYTYGGYHFIILDSAEINAFATPSGLIFVSRGMLRLTANEDELAAVLAHEVAHIELKHGIKAISGSRMTEALTMLAKKEVENQAGQLSALTSNFTGSISDITKKMVKNGYSQTQEYDADKVAIKILERAGYDSSSLVSVLTKMAVGWTKGGAGFLKTHPDPQSRISKLKGQYTTPVTASTGMSARTYRFKLAMTGI